MPSGLRIVRDADIAAFFGGSKRANASGHRSFYYFIEGYSTRPNVTQKTIKLREWDLMNWKLYCKRRKVSVAAQCTVGFGSEIFDMNLVQLVRIFLLPNASFRNCAEPHHRTMGGVEAPQTPTSDYLLVF